MAASPASAGTPHAVIGRVSHRNVEILIGRLATDPGLRRRFENQPTQILQQLHAHGYELTTIEIDALAALDPDVLRAFASALDRRLRKADNYDQLKSFHD